MNEDREYIEAAWRQYSDQLLAFICKKIDSHADAEDVLADVFLKLAKQTDAARVPHKLSNWLYLVTKNAIIDYYRLKKPLARLPEDLTQDIPSPQAISTLSACILPIIEELPEPYKLPIIRSEIDGKTHSQVAAELALTLPAVKSRILRGRKKLKDLMAKRCTFYYDESGRLVDYKENRKANHG